jgi:hypothetical protein
VRIYRSIDTSVRSSSLSLLALALALASAPLLPPSSPPDPTTHYLWSQGITHDDLHALTLNGLCIRHCCNHAIDSAQLRQLMSVGAIALDICDHDEHAAAYFDGYRQLTQ